MASNDQIAANRANSRLSTGPKTPEGKLIVARNSVTHGLSSKHFTVLPQEDRAEYEALLQSFQAEHSPATPTEDFLVTEMAQAQWKLRRVEAIEAELLGGASGSWAAVADGFRVDCLAANAILKLNRYEASARRAFHKALDQLIKLRSKAAPAPGPRPVNRDFKAKPIPAHLQRELDAHKRRDPLFNPVLDSSQMSKDLQRWFARQAA